MRNLTRHYSDDVLLAYADGELSWIARWRVTGHLKRCWQCRARLLDIEQLVRVLAKEAESGDALPAGWFPAAWKRFSAWEDEFERGRRAGEILSVWSSAWMVRAATVAASLSVCVAALITWHYVWRPAPRPVSKPAAPVETVGRAAPRPAAPLMARRAVPRVEPPPALVAERPASPSEVEMENMEVEAREALHRAGACLGEPVEVVRAASGHLLVHGRVASGPRRDELVAILQTRRFPAWVRVEIQAADEITEPLAALVPEEPAREVERVPRRLPIEDALASFLAASRSAMTPADFANRALAASEATLAEAWALRRLAERYPAGAVRRLDDAHRALLAHMLRDHARGAGLAAQGARGLLDPLLKTLAGDTPAAVMPGEAAAPELHAAVQSVFSKAERAGRLVTALFAASGPPPDSRAAARELLSIYLALPVHAGRVAGLVDRSSMERAGVESPEEGPR